MHFKVVFVLLLVFSLADGAVTFEDAYALYKAGEYEKSLPLFEALVKNENDADAAYILGYMYEHGEGCRRSAKKSQHYYKLSARGYYHQIKADPKRDIQKEHRKILSVLDDTHNSETQATIQQHIEALFNIKAYNENYFLPVSARVDNGRYAPTGTGQSAHNPEEVETEFQVSIKYDITSNLFGLHEIYTAAYTQHSFWQLYVSSAYFRESNYAPELFVTVPFYTLSQHTYFKALRFGIAHQSNGRGGAEERSWNYVYLSSYWQYKYLFAELKLWSSWDEALTYNPDLLEYLGYGYLKFLFPYKKHLLSMQLQSAFNEHYSVEVDYSYPLFGRDDLFVYLKGFSGYGESLIDYNNHVDKLSFGISISR